MICVELHTTVNSDLYKKLKYKYGNGILKDGIEKAVRVAEDKQYNVKSELIKIADKILVECNT